MKTTSDSIAVCTTSPPGQRSIEAEVVWPLAVHPFVTRALSSAWTVTHVPSGMALFYGRDRAHALELLAQCFDAFPADRWVDCGEDPEIGTFVAERRARRPTGV